MRIVAGERKGTRLAAPGGRSARPTTDRVRESLFSILGDVTEAVVLDPFAVCDLDRAALEAVRENARRLRYADRCTIRRQDGRRRLAADRAAGVTYDLVLLDPPYTMLSDLTDHLRDHLPALLAPGGRAVLERAAGDDAPEPGLDVVAERAYGGTAVTVWQRG
jgi:16S rRNA (guanine966-N2)-methyltransferase